MHRGLNKTALGLQKMFANAGLILDLRSGNENRRYK